MNMIITHGIPMEMSLIMVLMETYGSGKIKESNGCTMTKAMMCGGEAKVTKLGLLLLKLAQLSLTDTENSMFLPILMELSSTTILNGLGVLKTRNGSCTMTCTMNL